MKKIGVALPVLLAGVAVGLWWMHRGDTDEAQPEAAPTATVEVSPLTEQEIAPSLETVGVIVGAPSSEQVAVAAFDGIVRRVNVGPGTQVAAGDTLVELNPTPDARLSLSSAHSASLLADKTHTDTERRFELNLATRAELQTAQQAAEEAHLKVVSLEARGSDGDGRVLAVASGVVSKVDATVGTWAPAGTALATVTRDDQLEVRFGLEGDEGLRAAPGQTVTLTSLNRVETTPVITSLRSIGHTLETATGALEARASLPREAKFLLGEHLRVRIELVRKKTLAVSRSALLPGEESQVLFTVANGKAVRHQVTTGLIAGNLVEVSGSDLHAGDSVVTSGNYELADGMPVRVVLSDTGGSPAVSPTTGVRRP